MRDGGGEGSQARWGVGPSMYLMPEVIQRAFDDLGEKLEDWITLVKCEPNASLFFSNSLEPMNLSSSLLSMKSTLERYETPKGNPNPIGSFLTFLQQAGKSYEMSVSDVLECNFSRWWQMFRLSLSWKAWRMNVPGRLYPFAKRFFRSDEVRRAVTFSSMYLGSVSPHQLNLAEITRSNRRICIRSCCHSFFSTCGISSLRTQ